MQFTRLIGCLTLCLAAGATLLGQKKPDFSGTWELVTVERDGLRLQSGATTFKETQIWVHREPSLHIKIMGLQPNMGNFSSELEYVTDGVRRLVGFKTAKDGKRDSVYGSAHWDGGTLIYDQEIPNLQKRSPFRVIRSQRLSSNGEEMVGSQDYWLTGSEKKREAIWHWERKHDLP